MAKKSEKGKGSKNGNNGGGKSANTKELIERSEAGRERKRAERKQREEAKTKEQSASDFFAKKNAGRSSDIFALVYNQEPGPYAFQSVNGPAFCVIAKEEETSQKTKILAVYIEDIQKGHELFGKKWNPKTYISARNILNEKFASKLEGSGKETQELLWGYLSRLLRERISETKALAEQAKAKEKEELLAKARTNLKKLANGNPGFYRLPNGIIISLEEHHKAPCGVIKVVKSLEGSKLIAGDFWYVLVSSTRSKDFKKLKSFSDAVYQWGMELHSTIRMYCHQGISDVKRALPATVATTEVKQEVMKPEVAAVALAEKQTLPLKKSQESVPNVFEGAVEISTALFLGKPGRYFVKIDDGKAYFDAVKQGGMVTVEFIGGENIPASHPLAEVYQVHGSLQFPLKDLEKEEPETLYHDLDKKEARKAVRGFLRQVGLSLGLRPKQKIDVSSAMLPRDIRQMLSDRFRVEEQKAA